MAEETSDHVQVDGQTIRSLELTVLTQLRETLTGVTASLNKVASKVDTMHDRVMAIELAKFDDRIASSFAEAKAAVDRSETELQRQIDELKEDKKDKETRLRALSDQIARYGAFLAVIGTVGGAVVAAVATKVFGA